MITPSYLPIVKDLFEQITTAKKEVLTQLPKDLSRKHWIVKNYSPNTWKDVQRWYQTKEDCREDITLLIDVLIALSLCQENLDAVILQHRPMGNLKLAKSRPSSI